MLALRERRARGASRLQGAVVAGGLQIRVGRGPHRRAPAWPQQDRVARRVSASLCGDVPPALFPAAIEAVRPSGGPATSATTKPFVTVSRWPRKRKSSAGDKAPRNREGESQKQTGRLSRAERKG